MTYKFFSFVLLLGIFISSCSSQADTKQTTVDSDGNEVKLISAVLNPADFQAKAKQGDCQIVDVRTPAELAETGIIEGAVHMDYNGADFQNKISQLNPDKPILVYCKGGGRSAKTAKKLNALSFKEVYDLDGGITNWIGEQMPVVPAAE